MYFIDYWCVIYFIEWKWYRLNISRKIVNKNNFVFEAQEWSIYFNIVHLNVWKNEKDIGKLDILNFWFLFIPIKSIIADYFFASRIIPLIEND